MGDILYHIIPQNKDYPVNIQEIQGVFVLFFLVLYLLVVILEFHLPPLVVVGL
jgi:hypothetical protein